MESDQSEIPSKEAQINSIVARLKNGDTNTFTQFAQDLVDTSDRLRRSRVELSLLQAEKEAATIDQVTGLFNQKYVIDFFESRREELTKYGAFMIFIDVDYFKQINDRQGHVEGNRILKSLANALKGSARGSDLITRFGGDEFMVILTNTQVNGAHAFFTRLKENIKQTDISEISLSLEGTRIKPSEQIEETIKRADEAMYAAKEGKGTNDNLRYTVYHD